MLQLSSSHGLGPDTLLHLAAATRGNAGCTKCALTCMTPSHLWLLSSEAVMHNALPGMSPMQRHQVHLAAFTRKVSLG